MTGGLLYALALLTAASPAGRSWLGVSDSPAGRALLEHLGDGIPEVKLGDWATYRLDGGNGRVAYWRLAVVGEEKDPLGREAYWVEVDIGEHPALKAPLSQMRLLVAKGKGLQRDGVTRIYFAFAHEKPQELSEDAVAFMKRPPSSTSAPSAPQAAPGLVFHAGKEGRVMTPAGSVLAVPLEVRLRQTVLKRMWMSREVPVLHLVKLEIPAIDHVLEVHDFGRDAKSQMVLPLPTEPKVRMERYDEARPGE